MSKPKTLTRILIIASGCAFVGSTVFFTVMSLFDGNSPQPGQVAQNQQGEVTQDLANLETNFEKVLAKEPDNEYALKGLVDTRLKMNNLQGAIEPIEKLIELNPEDPNYVQVLALVKLQTNDTEGALTTMEKLVELDEEKYQPVLDEFKQRLAQEENSGEGIQESE